MLSTSERYHNLCGGYHEYIGGRSVHQRDIMSTLGVIMVHDVLMTSSYMNCDIPPMH